MRCLGTVPDRCPKKIIKLHTRAFRCIAVRVKENPRSQKSGFLNRRSWVRVSPTAPSFAPPELRMARQVVQTADLIRRRRGAKDGALRSSAWRSEAGLPPPPFRLWRTGRLGTARRYSRLCILNGNTVEDGPVAPRKRDLLPSPILAACPLAAGELNLSRVETNVFSPRVTSCQRTNSR